MSTPDLQVDADGYVILENGDLSQVTGDEAIAQALRIRLRSIKGEWFLNIDYGLNHDILFARPRNMAKIRREFRRVVMSTPGVSAMQDFQAGFDLDDPRQLNVVFSVLTENSQTLIIQESITTS